MIGGSTARNSIRKTPVVLGKKFMKDNLSFGNTYFIELSLHGAIRLSVGRQIVVLSRSVRLWHSPLKFYL